MQKARRIGAGKIYGVIIASAVVGLFVRVLILSYNKRSDASDWTWGCRFFGNRAKSTIRPVEKLECRGFTKEELREYDGIQKGDIYVSVKGVVYEVAPQFYGPGQPYHAYAGHEISRCLAKSDTTAKEANKNWMHDCNEEEIEALEWWAKKFDSKYPVVGWFVADEDFYLDAQNNTLQTM
ncbi:hypothetical protein TcCL_ESM12336 [Trypanosoma cruzi]|nr:hypothetical protein TcCL_ESM12336 [Trypanosoma cruzi]